MWFYEERFEYAFVGFDLPLKFIILFRPKPRLFWVRNEFVQIDGGAIRPQDCSIQSSLLQFG